MGFIKFNRKFCHKWNETMEVRVFTSFGLIICLIIYTIYTFSTFQESKPLTFERKEKRVVNKINTNYSHSRYLINTTACKIPDENPFNNDVLEYFRIENYHTCSKYNLLTYIEKEDDIFLLKINQSVVPYYAKEINCKYSIINRIINHESYKVELKFTASKPFNDNVQLSSEDKFVKVICTDETGYLIYENIHSIINPKTISKEQIQKLMPNSKQFNVLLFGIDTMSRSNLLRTMPKTVDFLNKHNFLTLQGYTKIGDNTFPNLVGLLNGRNWTQFMDFCDPNFNNVNKCDLIWDKFKEQGYVTAYAEDNPDFNTFNYYGRQGFSNPPTHYYFRPYYVALKELPIEYFCGTRYCRGPEPIVERTLNIARDFVTSLNDYLQFSLFWTSTVTHDDINCASMLDEPIVKFMENIYPYLNNTIFFFLSDHGFRFGQFRLTHSGWLEERLPFIYIHIPEKFQKLYPEEYRNFLINTKRLTTPYDIYMTLQSILKLSNDSFELKPSIGCPNCRTLFEEIPENRTCEDASISENYCVCQGYFYVDTAKPIITSLSNFVISKINALIRSHPNGRKCSYYELAQSISAGKTAANSNNSTNYYLIMFKTLPSATFEATVEVSSDESYFTLQGDISRLDEYHDNAVCVEGTSLEKYCTCDLFNKIKSAFGF